MNEELFREITELKEIQEVLLAIFVAFKNYCELNGLRYFLTGGTLLGAVRHKGFIPWDDDLDVMMPRPDYERLIELSQGKISERYEVWCPENTSDYPRLYMRVVDNNTVLDEFYLENTICNCLGIDVFPMDGIPDNPLDQKRYFRKIYFLRRIFILAHCRMFRGKNKLFSVLKGIISIPFRLSRQFIYNLILSNIRENIYCNCSFVGIVVGMYQRKEILKKEDLIIEEIVFSDIKAKTIKNWDLYLKSLYGMNYMEIPPNEKQFGHHTYSVWIKNKKDSIDNI